MSTPPIQSKTELSSAPAQDHPDFEQNIETESGQANAVAATPEETAPASNPKVLVISIGTMADLHMNAQFQYGDEIGAPRLEIHPPHTQNLGQINQFIAEYIETLRTPDPETGEAILGPNERLDNIIVEMHGSPSNLHIGGMDNEQALHISNFAFLSKYTEQVEFTGCNLGADIPGYDIYSSLQEIHTNIVPFTTQGTAVQLNSTYSLFSYGDFRSFHIDPCLSDEENIQTLIELGVKPEVAEVMVKNQGLGSDEAVKALAGPGGKAYRFAPDDKNKDGLYGSLEIKAERIHQNGDFASDIGGTGNFYKYSTEGIEALYSHFQGTEIENFISLDDERISIPDFAVHGLNDAERAEFFGTLFSHRFNQALAEGLSYEHPKALDMMLSFAKLKHKQPESYQAFKAAYEASSEDTQYFQMIEDLYNEIYGDPLMADIPAHHGTMLDNPQVPGQY